MTRLGLIGWAAGLALAVAVAPAPREGAASQTAGPPRLELPVACQPGRTCFIQQYFDHDSGPAARDHRCGPKAYDGHDGTDFRVPTRAAMLAGVGVRAAAAGTVKNVRDGVPDHTGTAADLRAAQGQDCGNAVVLMHPGGWETAYCHMKNGSVRVRPGQSVAVGASLGLVGQTGKAEFPHLHLGVREAGARIDPFAYGARPLACGSGGRSLWSRAAAAALAYRSPEVINAGFAAGPVTAEMVEAGPIGTPTATSPALVAYVRAIGLEAGDVQLLRLTAPGGAPLGESRGPELRVPRAQQLLFAGDRNSAGRLPSGLYTARYTVTRKGRTVLEHTFRQSL